MEANLCFGHGGLKLRIEARFSCRLESLESENSGFASEKER